jgi:hypothetical protein
LGKVSCVTWENAKQLFPKPAQTRSSKIAKPLNLTIPRRRLEVTKGAAFYLPAKLERRPIRLRYAGANLPFEQRKSTAASGPLPTFVDGAANGRSEPILLKNSAKCLPATVNAA